MLASVPEVEDALIVNLDLPGGRFFMPLFVKLAEARCWTTRLREEISDRLRASTRRGTFRTGSSRCRPSRTRSPASRWKCRCAASCSGCRWTKAANVDAMANPAALDDFVSYARTQQDYPLRDPPAG